MEHPPELQNLVDLEKQIEADTLTNALSIELVGKKSNLRELNTINLRDLSMAHFIIKDEDKSFVGRIDDQFIAQVIKRAFDNGYMKTEIEVNLDESQQKIGWKQENPFAQELFGLRIQFQKELDENFEQVISKIKKVLTGLVVLSLPPDKEGVTVYGIVSQKYKRTNQLEFREQFINLCKIHSDIINVTNSRIENIRNRRIHHRVTELFTFNTDSNDDIELICGLTYGKNNGYGSYYIVWERMIKESKSYLVPFQSVHNYNWKNNATVVKNTGETLESFVKYIIQEGIRIQELNRQIVEQSKANAFDPTEIHSILIKVLDKAKVANASKERCIRAYEERYPDDKNPIRNSLWAIGESIAYTGTHNKAIPESMKLVLKRLSTSVLSLGLEKFENTYHKDDINITIRGVSEKSF